METRRFRGIEKVLESALVEPHWVSRRRRRRRRSSFNEQTFFSSLTERKRRGTKAIPFVNTHWNLPGRISLWIKIETTGIDHALKLKTFRPWETELIISRRGIGIFLTLFLSEDVKSLIANFKLFDFINETFKIQLDWRMKERRFMYTHIYIYVRNFFNY